MKINKTRVRKLVKALRSGKYKQARGKLRRANAFCCLGVACDIYRKEVGGKWVHGRFLQERDVMPDKVSGWFGFPCPNPWIVLPNGASTGLADKNDSGSTFGQIAKLIEENFL